MKNKNDLGKNYYNTNFHINGSEPHVLWVIHDPTGMRFFFTKREAEKEFKKIKKEASSSGNRGLISKMSKPLKYILDNSKLKYTQKMNKIA